MRGNLNYKLCCQSHHFKFAFTSKVVARHPLQGLCVLSPVWHFVSESVICLEVCGQSGQQQWQWRQLDKEEEMICRSSLAGYCVQGATVLLSPPCIFHHALSFFTLFSFSLPTKLPCGACWHDIFQPCTQSPLVLRVLEFERGRVCLPACVLVCVPCAHACIHVNIGDAMLAHFPFSNSHITWSQRGTERAIERERERERERALMDSPFSHLLI